MRVSPFSGDPLHHFNAFQHTGPSLPQLAEPVELVPAGQRLELDHAEDPTAILDENAQPGREHKNDNINAVNAYLFHAKPDMCSTLLYIL